MSQITDVAVAQNIINTAIQHRAHGGTLPPDQAGQLQLANELVKMATDARAAQVPSPVIGYVLVAAGIENADGSPAAAPAAAPAPPAPPAQANPFGQQAIPTPPPAPAPAPIAPQPVAAPAPVQQAAPADINQIIPGYDDLSKDNILAALATLSPEQVEFVKQYEASEGERAFVANFQPVAQAATPTPAPAAPAPGGSVAFNTVAPESEASTEPWNGYGPAKIKDIVAVIEGSIGTHPDPKGLFRHIWTFEKANKDRNSLFKKLEEIANNGVANTAAPAPPVAPAPPAAQAAPAPQPGVHPEHPFGNPPAAAPAAPVAPAPVAAPTTEFGSDLAAPLQGSAQRAEAHVTSEFPLPSAQENIPAIPEDFSALSDLHIRQYASKFNAVQARLIVLLAQAKGHVADATNVADDAEKKYIREWAGDAKATLKTQEAHAADTAEVSTARHTAREWQAVVRYYEALVNIYDLTCKRLSREQTDRQEEKANAR